MTPASGNAKVQKPVEYPRVLCARRPTCDCCGNAGNVEFKKITELKDAGIALYRYLPQTEDEAQIGIETGEVLILQNTRDVDLKIEALTAKAGKETISCPRCIKMIERAKSLFKNLPPAKIREVAGICDHCYQKQVFPCPCCGKVVNKFLKFCSEEERKTQEYRQQYKSWLSKTQLSFKKSVSNIKDGKPETQTPVSRYIPTMRPGQDLAPFAIYDKPRFKNEHELIHEQKQVIEKPTRVLSFLDFSEEEKQRVKGQNELDREKIKRLAEENIGKASKSVSFDAFSKTDLEPTLINVKDIKVISPIDKPSTPIMEERIKSQPRMEQIIIPKPEIEKYSKPTPLTEKYTKAQSKGEKEVQLKSIMKKGAVEKIPHDVLQEDNKTTQQKRKLQGSPTARPSFGSIIKTLSEPNVSNFSYTFPRDKIVSTKQLKGHVSSSELIKSTQDMLNERKETERKKKEETRRKREEEKKQKTAEKARLLEEEKKQEEGMLLEQERKKREEGNLLEEERKKRGVGGGIESEERIGKESEQKARERKQDGIEAMDALKKGLSEQEKELSQREKLRRQQEKDIAFGDKKAKEAEKAIEETRQQLATHKKTEHPEAKPGEDEDRVRKGEKEKKIDQGQEKIKQGDVKQHDAEASSALKEQVAKQAKEKSEEEKLKKQLEKETALGEKRAQEAEKALEATQKQSTTEKKQAKRLSELKVPDDKKGDNKTDKDNAGKGEKMETTAKDQKAKGDDMAALLREQLAKQKQQELEKEKIRKEQEKEKELLAKKLKELESKKEVKEATKNPPVLETEREDSFDEIISDFTKLPKQDEVSDIILGQKIYKVKCAKKTEDRTPTEQMTFKKEPELHKDSELTPEPQRVLTRQEPGQTALTQSEQKSSAIGDKKSKASDTEAAKGVIRYTLSDRTFIEKGWTVLPMEKVVRKMNVYRMRPAKPEFDWFEHNKNKGELTYDSGEKLAEFDDNGRGRWYYRTGELALDYYDAEETNAGQRFVVYSTGQPDERGRSRPRTLLATFDYSGNGIVFDHTGKIRLKYNQTEGVVLDRTIGPVSHWKWHTLNDPPVLQQVMIDTQMPYKDPTILAMGDKNADAKRPDNEEMLAIEFENFLKEKRQKLTQSFKPFQIKMKAMKINEYFSLRVLDQASIYLLFRDGSTNLKLNIGMVLDHKEIVDTDTAEISEVSNTLDKLPACTDSIAELQKAVAKAQAQERFRVRHELHLKPPQQIASADALHAGCSRPLRTPVVQASLSSCDKMTPKRFKPSSSCNLYYSTQIL